MIDPQYNFGAEHRLRFQHGSALAELVDGLLVAVNPGPSGKLRPLLVAVGKVASSPGRNELDFPG